MNDLDFVYFIFRNMLIEFWVIYSDILVVENRIFFYIYEILVFISLIFNRVIGCKVFFKVESF